jgi:hypothetical protein
MKIKLYTLLLLVFACVMTHAQQQVPKNANKIVVKNDKTAADNFLAVKLILAEKAIEIASQDKDIYQVKTGVTPITKYGAGAYYVIFCKDNSIQLSGYFNTGLELNTLVKDTDPFKQIVNRKMGLYGESWRAMNDLAIQLGSDIEYLGGEVKPVTRAKRDLFKDDVY